MALARAETNGSINCVSASRPVLAVTAGGSPRSAPGRPRARRGSISGLRRLTLTRCSGEASTALRVTSAPVPAVVGTAMNGAEGRSSGLPRADHLQVVQRIAAVGRAARRWPCRRRWRCRRRSRSPRRSRPRAPRATPSRTSSTVGSPSPRSHAARHALRPAQRRPPRRPVTTSARPADLRRRRRHLPHRARPEHDPRRRREFESRIYQPSSPGKTLAYFTLVRGSAIIGATASRHAW